MGFFGFIGNIASAGVKVVLTPVAVVKDVVDGEPLETTQDLLESAHDDVEDAFDELTED